MDLTSSSDFTSHLIALVQKAPLWLSCLILFGGAFIEYIFPPFPGDTVVIAGGFFVARGSIPLWPSTLALVAGSTFGSMAGWGIGHYAQRKEHIRKLLFRLMGESNFHALHRTYTKYGNWILVLNRFLPGVRGFFMIGAGLANIPFSRVVLLGALSGLLWNALLIGLGFFLSASLSSLLNIFQSYTYAVIVLLFLAVGIWGFRRMRARRK